MKQLLIEVWKSCWRITTSPLFWMVLYGCTVRWRLFNSVLMCVSFGMLGPSQKKWEVVGVTKKTDYQSYENASEAKPWKMYANHKLVASSPLIGSIMTLSPLCFTSFKFHAPFTTPLTFFTLFHSKKKQPTNNHKLAKLRGDFFTAKMSQTWEDAALAPNSLKASWFNGDF